MANNENQNKVVEAKEIKDLKASALSLDKLPRFIEIMFKARQNLMLWGDPGIGKTAMVEQFVRTKQKENPKFGYRYYPLASKEPADLIGVPATKLVKDGSGQEILRTYWAIPNDLPTESDWEGVMFFDEFNNAAPAMQNAMQQLIQERRLGDYHLPKGAFIIAAGNLSTVNSYTTELQAPVKDRFGHKYVEMNLKSWINYMLGLVKGAKDKGDIKYTEAYADITQAIVQFVGQRENGEYLFDHEAMMNGSYTFATPRSWERIRDIWAENPDLTDDELQHVCTQYVGGALGPQLVAFKNDKNMYQNPREVLIEGKDFRDADFNGLYGTFLGAFSMLANALSKLPEGVEPKDDKHLSKMVANLLSATKKLQATDFKVAELKTILRDMPALVSLLDVDMVCEVGAEANRIENGK